MSKDIKLRKGYDIKIAGEAAKSIGQVDLPSIYSIKPSDFKGLVPKMNVEAGAEVEAGSILFHSKTKPDVGVASPVSGEITEIVRGEKRVITEIRILADNNQKYRQFGAADPKSLDRAGVKQKMLESGVWAYLVQRPFGRIADPDANPKGIFISSFDSAPLAPDYNFSLLGREKDFQTGLDALAKLTDGKVYLNLKGDVANREFFSKAKNVEINNFFGKHPAGNVGIQIHHLSPINKGEVVWTINPWNVSIIGKLFNEGIHNADRSVALCGSEVGKPEYYTYRYGASLKNLLHGRISDGDNRIICGNVLTGQQESMDGPLRFSCDQVTVIPEGKEYEFLGWLFPSYARPSISKTFLSYLNPNKVYKVNTNQHGEERAYVVTGEYEKVLPMDVMPVQLIKSILASDLENMESLGLLEVLEEDFALCEFVCTSKFPVQEIIRKGLDLLEREG